MSKLTGQQRFILARLWINSDKDYDLETYIKKVCQLKGIEYTPPVTIDRPESHKVVIKRKEETNE